ncbi:MAG: hypothetical protein QF473_28960 [Planctomycetota bacterium]|nr:hypothetical protein [Planctomycetota bacterium]
MMRLSQMIFFLCLLNVTQSHAEPMWEIRDTHIRFCKYLRTPRGNQKDAVKGRTILEVRGTYHFKGSGVLKVKSISLKLPNSDEKPKLLGVGMPAFVAAASYVYPEIAGPKGSTISSTKRGKFQLKEQPDGSVNLTLLQNPTQLSLAFDVPKGTSEPYILRFGPIKKSVPESKPASTESKPVSTQTKPAEEKTPPKKESTAPRKRPAGKIAASRLGMAKQLIQAGKKPAARRMLKEIVSKYSATPAATEARALLSEINK